MSDIPSTNDQTTPLSSEKAERHLVYSRDHVFRHMTRLRPEREQALYMLLDELLFYRWDALCLSIDEEYREVYYPFLPHLFDLLLTTEDGRELVDYLTFVEETRLGAITGDNLVRKRAWRLAEQVLRYKQQLFATEDMSSTSLSSTPFSSMP